MVSHLAIARLSAGSTLSAIRRGEAAQEPHTRLGVWAWLCKYKSIKGSTEEDLGTKRYIKKNYNSVDHVQVHS